MAVPDQPDVQLDLNTANPGQVISHVTTWPASGGTPYGDCTAAADVTGDGVPDGENSSACSWQYGWNRAEADAGMLRTAAARAGVSADPAAYVWWLDVERPTPGRRGRLGRSPATAPASRA